MHLRWESGRHYSFAVCFDPRISVKMLAIYIATLLVLIGSDILPSKVYAGSSKSSDSRGSKGSSCSKDADATYCKQVLPYQKAVEDKIKDLSGKKLPLAKCTCGTSGTISRIDILTGNNGKTTTKTLLTCSNCTGPHVPIASPTECNNVLDSFRGDLYKLCKIVSPRCKNFTVYRCGCPTVSSTTSRIVTTSYKTAPTLTTSIPLPTTASQPLPTTASQPLPTTASQPLPTTVSVTLPPTTTMPPPAATDDYTPFFQPGYTGYPG